MKKRNKNEFNEVELTEEEIANNHIVKSTNSYFLVFGIMALTIILLLIGSLFRSNVTPDYPLVFKDANNKLMFITKSGTSKSDISNIENANIIYANEDIRYLLYSNGKKLYLLDTTSSGEGNLLSEDVLSYGFSTDDKAVFYIENSGDLHVYVRKSDTDYLVDNGVSKALDIVNNNVIYEKEDNLKLKNYVTLATDSIAKSYNEITISKDTKYMLYNVLDNEETYSYYVYTFATGLNEKVLSNVYKVYAMNNSFTKFIYTIKSSEEINIYNSINDSSSESDRKFVAYDGNMVTSGEISREDYNNNKDLASLVAARNEMRNYAKKYISNGYDVYYQNKETKTLLAKGVSDLYFEELEDRKIIYSIDNWDKSINISDYKTIDEFKEALNNKKLNGLYFQVDVATPSLIAKNINEKIEVSFRKNDGVYFIQKENDINNLYYSKVSNNKAHDAVTIDSNLIDMELITTYNLGFTYKTNELDNNSLKYVASGKFKVINENVYDDFINVTEDGESIYYVKDYDNYHGSLMLFNGIRNSKLVDDVSSFMYINDELIYLTMNFDSKTETSDLYRLSGSKPVLIYENILEWFNPVSALEKK